MGKKHGVRFDLVDHLAIHSKVIKDYYWLIESGDTDYNIKKIDHGTHLEFFHEAKFKTTNGFNIEISKHTISSSENPPESGITVGFSYDCLIGKTNERFLHYHSPHSKVFNNNAPWHDKPHRHFFDGTTQNIEVYSYDHRPLSDKFKKYFWEHGPIRLTFLDHENWPFISEFLEEVSVL